MDMHLHVGMCVVSEVSVEVRDIEFPGSGVTGYEPLDMGTGN